MKKMKIAFICLTLLITTIGIIVAKANVKKQSYFATGYILKSDGITWMSITLCKSYFRSQGTCTQASLVDCNNNNKNIFSSASATSPAACQPH